MQPSVDLSLIKHEGRNIGAGIYAGSHYMSICTEADLMRLTLGGLLGTVPV